MSEEVGVYDAKTRLPEILRRVAAGERFVITRHGKAVAELGPPGGGRAQRAQAAVDGIRAALANRDAVTASDLHERIQRGRA